MELNQIPTTVSQSVSEYSKLNQYESKKADTKAQTDKSKKSDVYGEAAVVESSKNTEKKASTATVDRSKVISQLKADAEARMSQLRSLVEKMMTKQGTTVKIASFSDAIDFVKKGDFTVDEETKLQAQKDIAEDGYWGADQTSERLFSFAKALAGDDPSKIDPMVDAFKEGYKQAEKKWGGELPGICKKTYDSFFEKVDSWKKSCQTTTEKTETKSE